MYPTYYTGTCLTSILASVGKPPKAKRVAFAFILFKTVGAVVIFPVLSIFIWLLEHLSGSVRVTTSLTLTLTHTHSYPHTTLGRQPGTTTDRKLEYGI